MAALVRRIEKVRRPKNVANGMERRMTVIANIPVFCNSDADRGSSSDHVNHDAINVVATHSAPRIVG